MSGTRNTLGSLALLGITFLLGALVLEGIVRVCDLQGSNFTQPDRYTGWTHIRDQTGVYFSEGIKNEVVFNNLGLVGADTAVEKPPQTKRLLLIGDSFTESSQVPYQTNWGSQVGAKLGHPWETLNAGVSGYGTSHSALFLDSRGWDLDPDVVFLLFFTGNDVSDSSHRLGQKLGWQPQPYFELDPGAVLALRDYPLPPFDTSAKARVKEWLRNRSRLYLFARGRLNRLRSLNRQTVGSADQVPLAWHLYRRKVSPEWEEAWELTDQLLARTMSQCRNRNVLFGVGILPTGWRVDRELAEKLREDYPAMADTTTWDLSLPDRRLIQILDEQEIPYVNLTPVLIEAAASGQRLYRDHLTEFGHEIVADAIAEFLVPLIAENPIDSGDTKGNSSP